MSRARFLLLALAATAAQGSPHVVGYERFHAGEPSVAGGRLLYNELGCAGCHGGDTGLPARRAPDLALATTRHKPDWLRDYLADPAQHRAGTAMPAMAGIRDPVAADAVVHYLATLAPKTPVRPKLIRHTHAERGKELYHTIGCVACHAPREDYTPPEGRPPAAELARGATPLPDLGRKYVLASLAEFIRDPLKTRRDGRMPRIEMEEQDAIDLASYLLGLGGSDGGQAPKLAPWTADRAKAQRGREIVAEMRCAACHEIPGAARVEPVALRQLAGGCLAETPPARAPQFGLAAGQRAALQAYVARRDAPLAHREKLSLTVQALNCVACHERDGQGGPDAARKPYFIGDHNLGDTGRYPPPLTGVGRKLQPKALEQALNGAVRVRPYLQTQMPSYGTAVTGLPELLATADAREAAPLPIGDVEAGRKLLGTQGGASCITCHAWGERRSLGIHALDISTLAARYQPGWLREYLVNPAAYRPGTLMPSFWPDGKAANRDVLAGDTDRQIASILAFAREGQGLPEGFPAQATREFELVPQRPVVLRTFLQDVGTHAILVGFPAGVHLAYDGKAARPALAWKGRFFDAYGTWFSRFAPFEKPLGEAVVKWPAPGATEERRFDGYRLDGEGVPTFFFQVDGIPVEERFEPAEGGLRRFVRWNAEQRRMLTVSHPEGVTVNEEPASQGGQRQFLYTW